MELGKTSGKYDNVGQRFNVYLASNFLLVALIWKCLLGITQTENKSPLPVL